VHDNYIHTKEVNRVNFTAEIKRAMEKKNMRVAELSAVSDISMSYLYNLLSGQRNWNVNSLTAVCEALDLELAIQRKKKQTAVR